MTNHYTRIRNHILYGGLTNEEYISVKPKINESNRIMVIIFSLIATVFIGFMCLLSYILDSASQNRIIYTAGFAVSTFFSVYSIRYASKNPKSISFLVHISFSIFFMYGITIGTITNPSQQTVTFMVMLVFLPVLFIEQTSKTLISVAFYVLIFILLCIKRKTNPVLSTDITDSVIYGILGVSSGSIINSIKIRNYHLEQKLHTASRIDQLTRMNNRNSFESDLKSYAEKCSEKLTCIYFDVNGLHELNNTKGHKAGDEMLQYIASEISSVFSFESTYRIGGDEFVAFVTDTEIENTVSKINSMTKQIESKGYNVAVGYETALKNTLDIDQLIKSAEESMYRNKSAYYQKKGNDRRRARNAF